MKEDSVAVAHIVQPVRAESLREHWGTLSEPMLRRILLAIAWSVGLVE